MKPKIKRWGDVWVVIMPDRQWVFASWFRAMYFATTGNRIIAD